MHSKEIDLPTKNANVAEITLTGRYPEQGYVLNTKSEMIVRVLEGSAKLQYKDDAEVIVKTGETVFVPTNRAYAWVPNGSVTLYIVSTPPWTNAQQETQP